MEISCIIVDDAPLAIDKLKDFINKLPILKLLTSFTNGMDAIGFIKSTAVDLVFLDIQMEGFTGFQFLESLSNRPQIIITSAYSEYALKGYDFNVADYLLKPFAFERFVQAIDKVINILSENHDNEKSFMFVKTEYRIERVSFDDILYIEGMREYLQIVTTKTKIMTLQSFDNMKSTLPPGNFFRVHKSYIIALDKIDSIERGIIKIRDKRIPIGLNYKEQFNDILKTLKIN
jgi:two-component system LytT family response regulator